MKPCATCGNDYAKSFAVTWAGEVYTFDSLECAIHMLAPTCSECGCRILGHGLEAGERVFCCAHCARAQGVTGLVDHGAGGRTSGA